MQRFIYVIAAVMVFSLAWLWLERQPATAPRGESFGWRPPSRERSQRYAAEHGSLKDVAPELFPQGK